MKKKYAKCLKEKKICLRKNKILRKKLKSCSACKRWTHQHGCLNQHSHYHSHSIEPEPEPHHHHYGEYDSYSDEEYQPTASTFAGPETGDTFLIGSKAPKKK